MLTLPAREDDFHAATYQAAGELSKAGVKFAFSTGDSHQRADWCRTTPGCRWRGACLATRRIKALTINAAEILGVATRSAASSRARMPNLFISKGDPLEVKTSLSTVVINGQDVGLDNKHERSTRSTWRGSDLPPFSAACSVEHRMKRSLRFTLCLLAGALAFAAAPRADAPHVYAITKARLVTAAGAPIGNGTVVIRNGLIDAVGADVTAPADALLIDGTGLTVYPGLIDMGNAAGLDAAPPVPPATFLTRRKPSAGSAAASSGRSSRPPR